MNKIFDEILWRLYYATNTGIGYSGDPRGALLNDILKDLHNFTSKQLSRAIYDLGKQKLIEKKKYEGSILISLGESGMLRVLNYRFRKLNKKTEQWDGKWRLVAFDIPDSRRKGRRALAYRLKIAGFYEWQKSIFLYPFECQEELNAFTKLFKIEKYVRFGTMDFVDNQEKLKFHFKV